MSNLRSAERAIWGYFWPRPVTAKLLDDHVSVQKKKPFNRLVLRSEWLLLFNPCYKSAHDSMLIGPKSR